MVEERIQESDLPPVRVFLSSPGDVWEERGIALGVLRRLQGWFQGRLRVVPILWEHAPLLASAGFQEEIARRIPPSAADVAVFVLWSRLGTPLADSFVLEDGRRPTGTEWEFVDAMRAAHASGRPQVLVYRRTSPPAGGLPEGRQKVLDRLAQYEAVQQFFERHFRDGSGGAFVGAFHDFGRPEEFGRLLETHLETLLQEGLARAGRPALAPTWRGSPFRGLEPFEREHAGIFFGRTRALHAVLAALRENARRGRAAVLVVGTSGSGKSSLLRAGVLPQLTYAGAGEPGAAGACRQAVVLASRGSTPVAALVAALHAPDALPEIRHHGSVEETAALWTSNAAVAVSHVRAALASAAPATRLVMLVDQLEEVFTDQAVTAAHREAFFRVLDALARSGTTWVLATLRSDFYARLSEHPAAMALKGDGGTLDLLPPDPAEVADIVRWPARVAGLSFERDPASGRTLDEEILADAARGGADALPLLEHALEALHERRRGDLLTFEAYRAMGGIAGAVRERADAEWEALPAPAKAEFRAVLRALVDLGEGSEATATGRRVPLAAVARSEGARALVERFVSRRLLVADGAGDRAVVSVAHEALLRTWPRARDQVAAEADLLRAHGRLRMQAARWDDEGRPASLLLSPGIPLQEGRRLRAAGFDLEPRERALLVASETRVRRQRLGRVLAGVVALAATLGVGLWIERAADRRERVRVAAEAVARRDQANRAGEFLREAQAQERVAVEALAEARPGPWERRAATLRSGELRDGFRRAPEHDPAEAARWHAARSARAAALERSAKAEARADALFQQANDAYVSAGDREAADRTEGLRLLAAARIALARGDPASGYLEAASSRLLPGDADLAAAVAASRRSARLRVDVKGAWTDVGAPGGLAAFLRAYREGDVLFLEVDGPDGVRVLRTAAPGSGDDGGAVSGVLAGARTLSGAEVDVASVRVLRASGAVATVFPVDPETLETSASPRKDAEALPLPLDLGGLEPGEYVVRIRDPGPAPATRGEPLQFPVLLAPQDDWRSDLPIRLADIPPGMAYVPAGPFLLGSRDGADRERPLRWVELPAFFIGRTEVTVAEYERFAAREGYRTLAEREGFGYAQKLPDFGWDKVTGASFRTVRAPFTFPDPGRLPATQLAREDVEAYCKATGCRLPTEAEWEKAARGIDGRRAPWGQEPVDLGAVYRANINTSPLDADGYPWLAPVDAFPGGASPYGALGMVGSPFEWCFDRYYRDAYARPDPTVPVTEPVELPGELSDRFVGRGGASGLGGSAEARATSRRRLEFADRGDDLGFRVARSAP